MIARSGGVPPGPTTRPGKGRTRDPQCSRPSRRAPDYIHSWPRISTVRTLRKVLWIVATFGQGLDLFDPVLFRTVDMTKFVLTKNVTYIN